jgi:hypothetical protein
MVNKMLMHQHKQVEKKSKKKNIYLTFSAADWQNIEKINEEEIRIQGKMFDLKSIRFVGNEVVVYGHFDIKEDKLLAHAKDIEKKKQDQKKNNHYDQGLFFENSSVAAIPHHHYLYLLDYPHYLRNYLFQYNPIESPPPKVIS